MLKWTGLRPAAAGENGIPYSEDELRTIVAQAVSAGTIGQGKGRLLTSAWSSGS